MARKKDNRRVAMARINVWERLQKRDGYPIATAERRSKGTVYFISDGRSVKIGYTSDDPRKRLGEIQTGNPNQLSIVHTVPGTREDEKSFHKLFEKHRQSGEWFDYPPILEWIERLRNPNRKLSRVSLADVIETIVANEDLGARERYASRPIGTGYFRRKKNTKANRLAEASSRQMRGIE